MTIPESFEGSLALQFITSQGWNWRTATDPNIEIEKCPHCKHDGFHFRMSIYGAESPYKNKDGLYSCMRCGKGGNLYGLKQTLGIAIPGVESRKDFAAGERKVEALPDIEVAHQALLEDADVMDYLVNVRGFSREIIERQKLGIVPKRYFRETGEVKALVYPYLVGDNAVFVHYRTLPPTIKAFSSPAGWTVPLYNGEILNREAVTDVIFVEGEPDCIAAMDHGIEDICGVPGANFKKAEWISSLDKIERVYICYDKDNVGQKAAQELANRIGIEKCWKIVLPDFEITTESGVTRLGKDLNEYFTLGGYTAEDFSKLKQEAELFDVAGVSSARDALQELYDDLAGKKGLEPKYKMGWKSLDTLVGFDEGDVIDILAPEKIGKTTFALNIMEHMVDTYKEDGVFICLEMTRSRMARKWIAHKAQIEDNIAKNEEEAIALKETFMEAIPLVQKAVANREGDLYFCYPQYKTVDDIYSLMRDCIRRYGVKWIAIDNIQRMCDTTLGGKNRTQHLSEISKVISQIAKDFNVQIIRILQPHRVPAGKIATSDNVDGASQIGKDCDAMMILHRERLGGDVNPDDIEGYLHEEASFSDNMLVTVGLSRYSGGGRTTMHYYGATSTIMEKDEGQIAKMKAQANKGVGYQSQLASLKVSLNPVVKPVEDDVVTL